MPGEFFAAGPETPNRAAAKGVRGPVGLSKRVRAVRNDKQFRRGMPFRQRLVKANLRVPEVGSASGAGAPAGTLRLHP